MVGKICAALVLILSLLSPPTQARGADVEKIDRAWDEVYKNIGWLTRYFRDLTADGDAAERFDGYKALLNVLNDNYLNSIYYDTDRPEYLPYLRPEISNYCGPNTDFRYGTVHIEPGANYRVWGTRGNAEVVDLQQYSGWAGQEGRAFKASQGKYAQGTFESRGIKVDANGKFEFVYGPNRPEHGEQWWQAESDGVLLIIRDIFLDHAKEAVPGRFYFEKLGPKKTGPTTVSADEAAARLHAFAYSLKQWDVCFKFPDIAENSFTIKDWYEKPEARDKDYFKHPEKLAARKKVTAAQLTQTYHMAFYRVKPGEALIGEWRPPKEFLNWNIQLYTRLLQNLDFINRQTDINTASAHLDADGMVRFVISHKDPGVANWLDADGHPLGTVIVRCKICNDRGGMPTLKLVPESDVMKYLPADTQTVTAEARERILASHRTHYLMRYQQ